MKRIRRLTSSHDVRRVFARGARARVGSVLAIADRGSGLGGPRVAVVATRDLGGAVRRNRARRILREATRGPLRALPAGTDVVLVAKAQLNGKSFQCVEAEVAEALERAVSAAGRAAGAPC